MRTAISRRPHLDFHLVATIALVLVGVGSGGPAVASATPERRVVLMVWDGLRPDFISPKLTPTLANLATNGVFFSMHHSAYVSSTIVNGTVMATGVYPMHSTIVGNTEYRPALNWLSPVGMETVDTIRRGDSLSGGHFLPVPTVAELLHQSGLRTAVAGSKAMALLHDRANVRPSEAARHSPVVFAGSAQPSKLVEELHSRIGKAFPTNAVPNAERDAWTTAALITTLWKDNVPAFSVLWLSEPDLSQHANSPGSANALAGLASGDRNLAAVLRALEEKGVRDNTDILVVSDHGFSTIGRVIDTVALLQKAGFEAGRRLEDPEPGQVLVDSLGGSDLFYVIGHDYATTRRLVAFLQGCDFAGTIFCKERLPGTFPLKIGMIDSGPGAPDVVLSLRWSTETNSHHIPGSLTADGGTVGSGTHASLSRYDMHNTLVANGPGFKRGFVDTIPTGNVDLAPTILHLLGMRPARTMDGRVLREALAVAASTLPAVQRETLKATANTEHSPWQQYLKVSIVEGVHYLDEGNQGNPTE